MVESNGNRLEHQKALDIVKNKMLDKDAFSKWLGIELVEIRPGYCVLQMEVREEMLNGFSIAHGGITYSLADSALAFAANSYGFQAFTVETSISHTRKLTKGAIIRAIATEKNRSRQFGIYEVIIRDALDKTIALFKGTVFITENEW